MICTICGSDKAHIRASELSIARITLRAHVDCAIDNGLPAIPDNFLHSQYRSVSVAEIKETVRMLATMEEK